MFKKLLNSTPSAGGLKAKIEGLFFLISVAILVADCLKAFQKGYAELTIKPDDESGKTSTGGNGSGLALADNE